MSDIFKEGRLFQAARHIDVAAGCIFYHNDDERVQAAMKSLQEALTAVLRDVEQKDPERTQLAEHMHRRMILRLQFESDHMMTGPNGNQRPANSERVVG